MTGFRKLVVAGVCGAFCMASLVSSADVKAGAEAVVAKMPAQNSKDQYGAAADLVKLGPEGIAHVCGMLTPPATGGDTKVRFALNALSWYAHQPGKEADAKIYAGVLLDSLKAASDSEVKAFLIRQLHLLESEQAVPALGGLLSDARLCEPATQALLAIETKEAAAVLAKALPSAKGKNRPVDPRRSCRQRGHYATAYGTVCAGQYRGPIVGEDPGECGRGISRLRAV